MNEDENPCFEPVIPIPSVELGDKFKRPNYLPSFTRKIRTPCGNFYLTYSIALHKGRVVMAELFGSCGSLEREGALCSGGLLMTCKLISKTLQRGTSHVEVAMDIKGVPCPHTSEAGLISCPISIWKMLRDFPQEDIEAVLFRKEVRENACDGAPTDPSQAVPTEESNTIPYVAVSNGEPCPVCGNDDQNCQMCMVGGRLDEQPE